MWLAPTATVEVQLAHDGSPLIRFAEAQLPHMFSAVAVFVLLSFGAGALVAVAAWFGLKSMRGVAGLLLAVGASAVVNGLGVDLGGRFARVAHRALAENLGPGRYEVLPRLWFDAPGTPAWLLLICAPLTAVLVYLLLVLLAKDADLGAVSSHRPASEASSHGWPQGGELVGHPQGAVGEGVQAGWPPAAAPGPADGAGGHDHPAPRQDP